MRGGKAIIQALRKHQRQARRVKSSARATESYLSRLADAIPVRIAYVDRDLRYRLVNKEFERNYGRPAAELIGRPFPELLDAQSFEAANKEAARALAGETVTYERRVETEDGPRIYSGTLVPDMAEEGTVKGFFILCQDITERRRTESELRRARFAVEQVGDAMFGIGPDGRFTYANTAACDSLGYSRRELLGLSVADIDPEYPAEAWPKLLETLRRDGSIMLESTHRTKDGREFPVEITANLARFGDEDMVIAFARDISARKRAEAELHEAHDTLEQRVRERTTALEKEIAEREKAEAALRKKSRAARLLETIAVAANEATDPSQVIQKCLDDVCAYAGWPIGHAYALVEDGPCRLEPTDLWHLDDAARFSAFREATSATFFAPGVGLPGRALASAEPTWIVDVTQDSNFPRLDAAKEVGVRAGFAFPVLVGHEVTAVLEFFSDEAIEADLELLEIFRQIGTQLGRVFERNRAEIMLKASEGRLSGILDIAPDAIISIGTDGRIALFNQGAEAIFGYKAREVLRRPLKVLLPERVKHAHDALIAEFGRSGETSRRMTERGEITARHKDGSEFPAEASISKLDQDGETVFTVILRDVTERKIAEQALLAAKEEAEIASRAKTEFLANMSHELRTPLNAIIGFADLLKSEAFGPLGTARYGDYVADISESGKHLLDLINDILDISKVEAGRVELDESEIDVEQSIRSSLGFVAQRAETEGVKLATDLSQDGLPALRADARMVKQILINLLSNAVKFTPAGGQVTVRAWASRDSGLVLQVVDTGIGLAIADIPKALSRFGQVDGQLNRKYQGTGLGLPLTKSLVELHGGSLDLQSEVNVGTTVTVRFPAERIHDAKGRAKFAADHAA